VLDWYNPLISPGENPPRDPARDKVHGRIWRITYKHKPLLTPVDLSRQSLPQLLDNLKAHEDHFRYRSRARIREQAPEQVLPALQGWVNGLDKNDPEHEHHLLEALWLYQDFDQVREDLLRTLLEARDYRARAAATRVLFYWRDRLPDPLALFRARINDPSPRVRLEALVALSHFDSPQAVAVAADVLRHPTDYYLNYAMNETFGYLKPVWQAGFAKDEGFLADHPAAAAYLLGRLSAGELQRLPRTEPVLQALLLHADVPADNREAAVKLLAQKRNQHPVVLLLRTLQRDQATPQAMADLQTMLLTWRKADLLKHKLHLLSLLDASQPASVQATAYAALITAERSDNSVWKIASQEVQPLVHYLQGIALLPDPDLQAAFHRVVRHLTFEVPKKLERKYQKANPEGAAAAFYPVHAAAYRLLFTFPEQGWQKIQLLADLITPKGPYLDLALETISAKSDGQLTRTDAFPLLKNLLRVVEETPEQERKGYTYETSLALGKRLARLLPQQEGAQFLAVLEKRDIQEVKLAAVPAKMIFDQESITVVAGRSVSLLFENPDMMPHNVVIVQPGSAQKVGEAADAMASLKDGFEKHFVPDLPEVLFATPLVNKDQSFRLEFTAPEIPGEYPFICSFPGHWRVMKGVLKVVPPAVGKAY
jgi:azurin